MSKREPISHKRQRRAFTLVELLVVIAILGILMGLLLPAINSVRESMRRAQCKNNLHQIGVAANAHLAKFGFFPSAGWGELWQGDADRGTGGPQPGGWIYQLLPFMGFDLIHDLGKGQGGAGLAVNTTSYKYTTAGPEMRTDPIPVFNCPARRRSIMFPDSYGQGAYNSWPGVGVRGAGLNHSDYCANTGTWDPGDDIQGDVNCMKNYPNCAWNADATSGDGVVFQASQVTAGSITDGQGNTFFAGEKWLGTQFYYSSTEAGDDGTMMMGLDHDIVRWCGTNQPPVRDSSMPGCTTNSTGDYWCTPNDNSFGSPHAAGVNFVYCDCSVRLISYQIDPTIYTNLGCRNDGNVNESY